MPLYRLPAHVINGCFVALGIGLLQGLFGLAAGPAAAQLAVSGAIFASLSDLPTTHRRSWGRVLAGGLMGCAVAVMVTLLRPWPGVLTLAIGALGVAAMLCMAWGPRAGPLTFAPVLALVFTLAHPPAAQPAAEALHLGLWHLAGVLAYLLWSQLSLALLLRRYRSLALSAALEASARLLDARADLLDQAPSSREGEELPAWLRQESLLAERLQAARDLLFAAPPGERAARESAVLLQLIDLRDILLASRLDLELLGEDDVARRVRAAVAARLRALGAALRQAAARAAGARTALAAPAEPEAWQALLDAAARSGDARVRLLPALRDRLRHLDEDLARIQALLGGAAPELPLRPEELRLFVAPEGWPLASLRQHLSLGSPVLRHALRFGLALGCAHALALHLPWAAHPQWLVLSVAVVLRGNLEQTLARRNARVGGTVLGCLLVLGLAQLGGSAWVAPVFLLAVGLAHGFALERYLVTASAATVMALLQQHLAQPAAGFAIGERLADTLLGALLAWAFCFVLPAWERRLLPLTLARARRALAAYAHSILGAEAGSASAQRLARRQAYEALGALGAMLQRAGAEPARVRLPLRELAELLDHGHRLMAHLSMLRLMLSRRREALDAAALRQALDEADAALQRALLEAPQGPVEPSRLALLPERSPAEDPQPWLLRRLHVAVQDARRLAAAAERAATQGPGAA